MPVYSWKGISAGQHSSGDIEAKNLAEAKAKLQSEKIIFTQLKLVGGKEPAKSPTAASAAPAPKKQRAKKIPNRDLMIFTKKFATMVQSGLPILKTLKMLESQTENKYFRYVLHTIYTDVESGSPLSDAFVKHPSVFDSIYINLLRAGETSGKLTIFLQRLVIQIEKSEKIRAKVKGALTYPTILVVVATAVIVLMLVKVVPVFQSMFSSAGENLPGPTQLIITMSEFLRNPSGGGTLFFIIVSAYFSIRFMIKNNYTARYKVHALFLKIPLIREVIQRSTLSKISMIMGNLSSAGVSVLESIDIVNKAINNEVYKKALLQVKSGISEGRTLSALFSEHEAFHPTFCQMLAVGEETGNMDEMFEATARYFEEEFDMVVNRLTELLEPFMIVFMGLTIGFIIVALYMPIFQIGQTLMPH